MLTSSARRGLQRSKSAAEEIKPRPTETGMLESYQAELFRHIEPNPGLSSRCLFFPEARPGPLSGRARHREGYRRAGNSHSIVLTVWNEGRGLAVRYGENLFSAFSNRSKLEVIFWSAHNPEFVELIRAVTVGWDVAVRCQLVESRFRGFRRT